MCEFVCVRVCVRERESERERVVPESSLCECARGTSMVLSLSLSPTHSLSLSLPLSLSLTLARVPPISLSASRLASKQRRGEQWRGEMAGRRGGGEERERRGKIGRVVPLLPIPRCRAAWPGPIGPPHGQRPGHAMVRDPAGPAAGPEGAAAIAGMDPAMAWSDHGMVGSRHCRIMAWTDHGMVGSWHGRIMEWSDHGMAGSWNGRIMEWSEHGMVGSWNGRIMA